MSDNIVAELSVEDKQKVVKAGYKYGFEDSEGYFIAFSSRQRAHKELAKLKHNAKSAFRPGQDVVVYLDPVTNRIPEGTARLKRFIRTDGIFDYWMLAFEGRWDGLVERKLWRGDATV